MNGEKLYKDDSVNITELNGFLLGLTLAIFLGFTIGATFWMVNYGST